MDGIIRKIAVFELMASCRHGSALHIHTTWRKYAKHFTSADCERAVSLACIHGHMDALCTLVQHVNVAHMEFVVAVAAENGRLSMIEFLIARGAPVHPLALSWSVASGYVDTVRYILDNGLVHANANHNAAINRIMHTPDHAVSHVLDLLMQHGADIHVDDDFPLRMCALEGKADAVAQLIRYGADVHVGHDLALQWACIRGHHATVRVLLENGACVDANDHAAIRHATKLGYFDIATLLMHYGAMPHNGHYSAPRSCAWLTEHAPRGFTRELQTRTHMRDVIRELDVLPPLFGIFPGGRDYHRAAARFAKNACKQSESM